ncbi:MAG: DUF5677 domain-containing protein [candidate division Zixibacteria bacterium]|nr:DUF5677 domain-containing protein [candidate division Zixibacteria bacterium]
MQERLKEIYELNNSLLQLAENLQDEASGKIKMDSLKSDLFLLCFFFTKASKTASAIVMLCQEGYAEDAYILARTIFEIVVKSLYIFKSDSIERARAFILYDHLEKRKRLRKLANWNKEKGIMNNNVEEELKKEEEICTDLEKDYQIDEKKVRWSENLEEVAKEVDFTHQYYTAYCLSSHYVHTSVRSSRSFVFETDKGLSFYIGPNEELSQDVLIWLFDLFRLIVREFDNRFNLGYQDKILEVEEKFNKFMQSVINEK